MVATSDNPRSEDPLAILAEIEPALKASGVGYVVEPDRAAAIGLALKRPPARCGSAGRQGPREEQILADHTIPFDDAQVAVSALAQLGYGEQR